MRKKELPGDVCQEAFPFDPDFPQLLTASDPGLMLEIFRRHLKPVSGKVCHIQQCVPFRFRCRQSTSRCVLQYTLRIAEPGTGRQWDQWVTGLIYAQPGEAERLCREMQAADPRREVPEAWLTFEPVDFIPELRMLVQIFPYDRKLPNLCLVTGEALHSLERLLLSQLGPGQWQTEQQTIEPTRYRTELGAALRYTLQAREALSARRETRRCYLKVYRDERGLGTLQVLQALSERADAAPQLFSVVRPVAYLSELRTLVLEEAPGTPLQQVLLAGRDPEAAVRIVARAVAAFNNDEPGISSSPRSSLHSSGAERGRASALEDLAGPTRLPKIALRPHSLAEQIDDVKRASTLVQWACPQARAEVKAITAAVVAGLEEVPPAPIHRDIKTDHVFLSGDRVVFIDLDSVALGDPARDPAHLWAHIAGRVGLDALSPEQARMAAAAFVEEYFAHVPTLWRARFPLHCAGAIVEVAGAVFKRQEPCWRQTVPALVEQARLALSGGFS